MIRRLPFTIGVYAVMAFVFLLLRVNTTFEIAFCIAGITVIGIFLRYVAHSEWQNVGVLYWFHRVADTSVRSAQSLLV